MFGSNARHISSFFPLTAHLETLLGPHWKPVQQPEPQAPVDDVGPVVVLSVHLLGLGHAGVVRQGELVQPGEGGQLGDVPQ